MDGLMKYPPPNPQLKTEREKDGEKNNKTFSIPGAELAVC